MNAVWITHGHMYMTNSLAERKERKPSCQRERKLPTGSQRWDYRDERERDLSAQNAEAEDS